MNWTGLNTLREQYLSFFEQKEHCRLPSFPLIPQNDPSLLLINSGMAPMKKWFSGQEIPPAKRVTTCQKCIRTPDIENVGKTARHGTFFEMLGNFSFGDYFKPEAISWAWEFITQVLKMPLDRLWVSIYDQDLETYDIWLKQTTILPDHLVQLGKKDNFWEIGLGPCGPCSEIYFDRGAQYACDNPHCGVGCDCDRYVEFWNLVFTQFDHDGHGNYSPLAHPNIDTGMGLERLACILQGVDNLFEVDTVQHIMNHISQIVGVSYHDNPSTDVSLRVMTDHIRSTVFLLADGVTPSNEGRGYVLKRLLRRAARHGLLLDINKPFLYHIVPTVIAQNQLAYPEFIDKQDYLQKIIRIEEENFSKTLLKGIHLLNHTIDEIDAATFNLDHPNQKPSVFSGEEAFRLYDTYGLPVDLTREILSEYNMSLDEQAFEQLMVEQKQRARQARIAQTKVTSTPDALTSPHPSTTFVGDHTLHTQGTITGLLDAHGQVLQQASSGETITLLVDQSPFYAENGGQVSDQGTITIHDTHCANVLHVQRLSSGVIGHQCHITTGCFSLGQQVTLQVDPAFHHAVKQNHTSAHLLHATLRHLLGNHVHQAGQLVNAQTIRFDFSHFEPLTSQQLHQLQQMINQAIVQSIPVLTKEMPLEQAKKQGAIGLFDDKYGDIVRVVQVGDLSMELCGGSHVNNTAQIGLFHILNESSVAAGVRRIEACTSLQILHRLEQTQQLLTQSAQCFKLSNLQELPKKCSALMEELRLSKQQLAAIQQKLAQREVSTLLQSAQSISGCLFISSLIDVPDIPSLRAIADQLKGTHSNLIAVLATQHENQGNILCVCGKQAQQQGAHAGNLVREIAAYTGGKGGGRPDHAMAGVGDCTKLLHALQASQQIVEQALNQ